jgi:DNA invertase Pin-like site-specific DNA recombinase
MTAESKRVAIYTRVSTEKQSTESQRLKLHEWAENAGHEVVKTYDEKISGAKKHRPKFNELVKDAADRKFDIVAVWDVDRFGRSLGQVVTSVDDLAEIGIIFWIAKSHTDTSTQEGKMLLAVYAMFAEMERDFNRQRTRDGIATARRRGKKLGRPEKGSVRDQHRASSNRTNEDIRSMLNAGTGINRIARQLSVGERRITRIRDEMQR